MKADSSAHPAIRYWNRCNSLGTRSTLPTSAGNREICREPLGGSIVAPDHTSDFCQISFATSVWMLAHRFSISDSRGEHRGEHPSARGVRADQLRRQNVDGGHARVACQPRLSGEDPGPPSRLRRYGGQSSPDRERRMVDQTGIEPVTS